MNRGEAVDIIFNALTPFIQERMTARKIAELDHSDQMALASFLNRRFKKTVVITDYGIFDIARQIAHEPKKVQTQVIENSDAELMQVAERLKMLVFADIHLPDGRTQDGKPLEEWMLPE